MFHNITRPVFKLSDRIRPEAVLTKPEPEPKFVIPIPAGITALEFLELVQVLAKPEPKCSFHYAVLNRFIKALVNQPGFNQH